MFNVLPLPVLNWSNLLSLLNVGGFRKNQVGDLLRRYRSKILCTPGSTDYLIFEKSVECKAPFRVHLPLNSLARKWNYDEVILLTEFIYLAETCPCVHWVIHVAAKYWWKQCSQHSISWHIRQVLTNYDDDDVIMTEMNCIRS